MIKIITGFLLLLAFAVPLRAAEDNLPDNSFVSGQKFLELDEHARVMFISGQIEGMLCAPCLGAQVTSTKWLSGYVAGKSFKQMGAIVTKYLQDNPTKWGYTMNFITYFAICGAYQQENPGAVCQ